MSVKVSSVASQLVTWDLEGSRDRVVERLLPLFRAARDHGVFLNLDMEEYRDLALTTRVFEAILGREEFRDLEAGIVLQAYLPDALGALDGLTAFATERVAAGGAPVKVRLVKGANLAMEKVEAELHGWEQAPYPTKPDVDANYVRLRRPRAARPRVPTPCGSVSRATTCSTSRSRSSSRAPAGSADALDIEMLQGMAPGEARAVRDEVARDGGRVVLYTPVVAREDFDVAISYLVRRLEENAAEQNFLHAMFAPAVDPVSELDRARDRAGSDNSAGSAMDRQEAAYRASVELGTRYSDADVTPRRRVRSAVGPASPGERFTNASDTDPAVAANRAWAARVVGPDSGYVPAQSPR